jgi:hypothetical protein
MNVSLIQFPYMMGDERQGKGPLRLLQAGADKLVAAKGIAVAGERIDRGEPFRDSGNASLTVCFNSRRPYTTCTSSPLMRNSGRQRLAF